VSYGRLPELQRAHFQHPESAASLQAATGEWEFSSDGTSVNTTEGRREIRLSVLSKRESGEPAIPRQ
jgi:hypothetical protein